MIYTQIANNQKKIELDSLLNYDHLISIRKNNHGNNRLLSRTTQNSFQNSIQNSPKANQQDQFSQFGILQQQHAVSSQQKDQISLKDSNPSYKNAKVPKLMLQNNNNFNQSQFFSQSKKQSLFKPSSQQNSLHQSQQQLSNMKQDTVVETESGQQKCSLPNKTLCDLIQKNKECYSFLQRTISQISELMSKFESSLNQGEQSEFNKISQVIMKLANQLDQASQNEIQLTKQAIELENQKQLYANQQLKYNQSQDRLQSTMKRLEIIDQKREELEQEKTQLQKNLQFEKRQNIDQRKEIEHLESRLKIILDTDFVQHGTDQDQIHQKRVLSQVVKENESLKLAVDKSQKENLRIQEMLSKTTLKLNRLIIKMNIIKKKISIKDLEQINTEYNVIIQNQQNNLDQIDKDDPLKMLTNQLIPKSLDYRITVLKKEQGSVLQEINDQGAAYFVQQMVKVNSLEQSQEKLFLVVTQYVSFKEFGDKMALILKNFCEMNSMQDLDQLMNIVCSQFKQIFLCERVNLWILDNQTGIFYTKKEDANIYIRALKEKGVFGEVCKNLTPITKKLVDKINLYQLADVTEKDKSIQRVKSTICIPIIISGQLNGILEISNSKGSNFSYDEEYFALLLSSNLAQILAQMSDRRLLQTQIKYNNYFNQAFSQFVQSESQLDLQKKVGFWIKKIFSVEKFKFYFVKNDKLMCYQEDFNQNMVQTFFSTELGIAGWCVKNKQNLTTNNITESFQYESNIDIYSILPIQIVLLQFARDQDYDQTIYGVLEIVVKKKFKISFKNDELLSSSTSILGIDYSFEHCIKVFSDLLAKSIFIVNQIVKDSTK